MKFCLGGISGALFVLLILLVRTVDVDAIGPEGSSVGFSKINGAVKDTFSYNETWYKITQYLGYAALAIAGGFALLGLVQLIRRKSLFKVDKNIIALGVLFTVVIILYVMFNKIAVNYRPVILPDEGVLEASYPSSHSVLTCVVMGGAMLQLPYYVKNQGLRLALNTILALIILLTVGGRLVSGAHWLTDILGGVLLSGCLLFVFSGVLDKIESTEKQETVV
ncbi:MAG: phosphatase PAP2 family protein [Eubacterium sp.]|nr:phosphatase PAP2 family protein [Eubacterium sp.]